MTPVQSTPGPWRYQEMSDAYTHIVRGPNNEFILYGPQSATAEVEADIRLAATAPEMREALLLIWGRVSHRYFSVEQAAQIEALIARVQGVQQ